MPDKPQHKTPPPPSPQQNHLLAALSPEVQGKWEAAGLKPLGGSIDDAIKRNRIETEQWTKVIKAAKIVAE